MGDVGMAIQRAEDKTAQMQARAGAIDELLASGALDDPDRDGQGRHHSRAGAARLHLRRRERARPDEGLARRLVLPRPPQAIEGQQAPEPAAAGQAAHAAPVWMRQTSAGVPGPARPRPGGAAGSADQGDLR